MYGPSNSFLWSEILLTVCKMVNTLEGYNILEGFVPLQKWFQAAVTSKSKIKKNKTLNHG